MSRMNLYHRIVTTASQWMTAQDAANRHPPAAQRTIALDGFHCIFGAGWNIPARWRKERRNSPLVALQHMQRNKFGKLAHL